jgi:hypothetical protein
VETPFFRIKGLSANRRPVEAIFALEADDELFLFAWRLARGNSAFGGIATDQERTSTQGGDANWGHAPVGTSHN